MYCADPDHGAPGSGSPDAAASPPETPRPSPGPDPPASSGPCGTGRCLPAIHPDDAGSPHCETPCRSCTAAAPDTAPWLPPPSEPRSPRRSPSTSPDDAATGTPPTWPTAGPHTTDTGSARTQNTVFLSRSLQSLTPFPLGRKLNCPIREGWSVMAVPYPTSTSSAGKAVMPRRKPGANLDTDRE